MPKQFERKIVCKNCATTEIGLFEGKWYNVDNENQLHFTVCPNAPHKQSNAGGYKSQYRSKTKNIEYEAVAVQLEELKERVSNLEEIAKAHTLELSFKKGNGEPVNDQSQ